MYAVLPSTCEGALITKSRNSEAAGENKQYYTSGWPQFGCGDILGKRKRDILLAYGQAKPATTYSEAGGNIQRYFFCWPKVGRGGALSHAIGQCMCHCIIGSLLKEIHVLGSRQQNDMLDYVDAVLFFFDACSGCQILGNSCRHWRFEQTHILDLAIMGGMHSKTEQQQMFFTKVSTIHGTTHAESTQHLEKQHYMHHNSTYAREHSYNVC